MSIDLIKEVMDHAPAGLTPQERLAAMVFAEDAWLFPDPDDRNHKRDRKIPTPLADEKFQRRIGVNSARKVLELAQSLVRKGVLENVTRGQKGRCAEYKFARLAPVQHPGIQGAEDGESEAQDPGFRGAEAVQDPGKWGAEGVQHPGNRGAYNPPSPKPPPPAADLSQRRRERAEAEEAAPSEPHPDAVAILDKLDLNRRPGKREREQLLALITAALIAGWAVPDIVANLNYDWTGANDRVRTAIGRAKDLDFDNPPTAEQARASPKPPHCGKCNEYTRRIEDAEHPYPCPDCHPATQRKAA